MKTVDKIKLEVLIKKYITNIPLSDKLIKHIYEIKEPRVAQSYEIIIENLLEEIQNMYMDYEYDKQHLDAIGTIF